MDVIIGLGILLVLIALYLLFRVGNLVSIIKPSEEPEGTNTRHGLYFMIFMIVSLIVFYWYSFVHFDEYNLPVASIHGKATDYLFWLTMTITLIAFTIIFIVMFWFTFKYRYNKNRRATFYADNTYLEVVWTVIPAIVLALLIFGGLREWGRITSTASDSAEVIEVVGQQFAWTIRYPGVHDNQLGDHDYRLIDAANEFGMDLTDQNAFDDFKATELHLPKGCEVLLKIRAKDVIHSVFLPHFRVKMDAVPGMETVFKFTPTKTTQEMRDELGNSDFNYEMACTEICGEFHFSMRLIVIVDEPDVFEKWKSEQVPWLRQNPEYLSRVPDNLKEMAKIKAGIENDAAQEASIISLN